MRRVVTLLLIFITLRLFAFVEVKDAQFHVHGSHWRIMGVNLTSDQCSKEMFQSVAAFGWNCVRIVPETVTQLKQYAKWAKHEQLKLYVVITPNFPIESIGTLKNNRQIFAWEVTDVRQAKLIKENSPHHLVTLFVDSQLNNMDSGLMASEIDALSITLNPLENKWVAPTNLYLGLRNCYMKSNELFQQLARRMSLVEKPILVVSCSYPRDKMFKLPGSSTSLRDSYFNFIINSKLPYINTPLAGVFFQKWELMPTEETQIHCTEISIFPTDTITRDVLF